MALIAELSFETDYSLNDALKHTFTHTDLSRSSLSRSHTGVS